MCGNQPINQAVSHAAGMTTRDIGIVSMDQVPFPIEIAGDCYACTQHPISHIISSNNDQWNEEGKCLGCWLPI